MAAGDLITRPWHLEWRQALFGWPSTRISINGLTGWLELPAARTTMTDRAGRHGSFPGAQSLGTRTIEVTFNLIDGDPAVLAAVRRAFAVVEEDQDEEPLVVWAGTDGPELVYARIEKASIPTDLDFSNGLHTATVQWIASDPLRYSPALHIATVGLSATGGGHGLRFPLDFPLDFGDAVSAGTVDVVNAGNAVSWPMLYVYGPPTGTSLTGITITHTQTGRRLVFSGSFTVAAGTVVQIDTTNRYVSVAGVSRNDQLVERGWFGLTPGAASTILFTATTGDPSATLSIQWRDANSL